MTREQCLRLWFSTLASREPPAGGGPGRELLALWEEVALPPADRAKLAEALREPDGQKRREALIRATRRLLADGGVEVDLLSTPAARMVGI